MNENYELLASFNTNIMTQVKLEEEIEKEGKSPFLKIIIIVNDLKSLRDFVRNDAISSLIVESLTVTEGGPTDSASLK